MRYIWLHQFSENAKLKSQYIYLVLLKYAVAVVKQEKQIDHDLGDLFLYRKFGHRIVTVYSSNLK